jgi:hypothetical protein
VGRGPKLTGLAGGKGPAQIFYEFLRYGSLLYAMALAVFVGIFGLAMVLP